MQISMVVDTGSSEAGGTSTGVENKSTQWTPPCSGLWCYYGNSTVKIGNTLVSRAGCYGCNTWSGLSLSV